MSLRVFTHETLQQTFLQTSAILDGKRPFLSPLGGLGGNTQGGLEAKYDVYLTLIGKRVVISVN